MTILADPAILDDLRHFNVTNGARPVRDKAHVGRYPWCVTDQAGYTWMQATHRGRFKPRRYVSETSARAAILRQLRLEAVPAGYKLFWREAGGQEGFWFEGPAAVSGPFDSRMLAAIRATHDHTMAQRGKGALVDVSEIR